MLRDANLEVGVSFCPERIAQGCALDELTQLPQIVAGSDASTLAKAKKMFSPLGVDLVELGLQEAEVAKLFLNASRYVLFGVSNQFYQITASKGLDFNRIFTAITYKYRRSAGFPRPGFTAGPRLFKDTMQLAAYCRHTFSLGHAAMLVNETMPDTVLEQAKRKLDRQGLSLAGMKVGILGMAYKPDNDDTRESLSFKLRRLLRWEGAEVLCTDVHVRKDGFKGLQEVLDQSQVIFIGCPHKEYKTIEFRKDQIVVDCFLSTAASTDPKLLNITAGTEIRPTKAARVAENQRESVKRVAIIGGAGHVGLPLALVLADHGFEVVIVDLDQKKMDSIKAGNFPFEETGGPELLARAVKDFPDRLIFSTEYSAVKDCSLIIVTIGTPVDEHLNPLFSGIEACIKRLRPSLHDGQTLVLRSTLFPGSSTRIQSMLRAEGLDIGVTFCPERIAQGYALEELTQLPQIVAGSNPVALARAKSLFEPLGVDLVELDLQEAEVAKLFLNSWRYVVFGTANQFYQIAMEKGLDFYKIHAAITHKYNRAGGLTRPGFTAGPCLFKDTMQLAAYCRHTYSLGHASMLVNETMPNTVTELAKKELAAQGLTMSGTKVGILGMAFKPNNDDFRESLAFKLRRLLLWEGADLLCTDVYIKRDGYVELEDLLSQCKIIVIGCPHREYDGIKYKDGQSVIDCWGSVCKPAFSVVTGDGRSIQ